MRRIVIGLIAGVGAALPVAATAQDSPDLKGTWLVEVTGIGHPNTESKRAEMSRLLVEVEAEVEIDWQEGPRFSGRDVVEDVPDEIGNRQGELVSGVIMPDNRTVYMVDDDGTQDCTIVSPDELHCVYRHVLPAASVASINIWTRKP